MIIGTSRTTFDLSTYWRRQKPWTFRGLRLAIIAICECVDSKGLFTWREGAPANRATRLEGLKHSPSLHATSLIGTVSELHWQSFERPLTKTNKMADQKNFLAARLIFFRSFH